jgi:hypothetical protein
MPNPMLLAYATSAKQASTKNRDSSVARVIRSGAVGTMSFAAAFAPDGGTDHE